MLQKQPRTFLMDIIKVRRGKQWQFLLIVVWKNIVLFQNGRYLQDNKILLSLQNTYNNKLGRGKGLTLSHSGEDAFWKILCCIKLN